MAQSQSFNNPLPINRFAKFFRSYGVGLSLVVATLPIFISNFNIIPVFAATKNTITIITSVASYLLVGFIFSQRHALARIYFPGRVVGSNRIAYRSELALKRLYNLVPLVLAILFIILFVWFNYIVRASVQTIAFENAVSIPTVNSESEPIRDKLSAVSAGGTTQARLQAFGVDDLIRINYRVQFTDQGETIFKRSVHFPNEDVVQNILKNTPSTEIPNQDVMILLFLWMFVFATSAFILMGLQDYLQSDLGLSDQELMLNPTLSTKRAVFDIQSLPGLYGVMEYSPASAEIEPIFSGPYCIFHKLEPEAASIEPLTGKVTQWVHRSKDSDGKVTTVECPLELQLTEIELEINLQRSGREIMNGKFTSKA